MAINLEDIKEVLSDPTTVNLHKNSQYESEIKVDDRTDLNSIGDMGQNYIYSNSEPLEKNPRVGKFRVYPNVVERRVVGSSDSVQRNENPLALQALGIKASITSISDSSQFIFTLTPTPNVTNLICNIGLRVADTAYEKYFTISKVDNFKFLVTPDYEALERDYGSDFPFSIRFLASDMDNPKIAYTSTKVNIDYYMTIRAPQDTSGTSSTQQIHVMYSAREDHSDMAPAISNASYMGLLIDNNINASMDPSDYTWTKIKGDKGSEGQAGRDGIDGKDGKDAVADPSIDVYLSSNIFPVGQDGWATENKDISYKITTSNTSSAVRTRISIDGSGNPYAFASNYLDGFIMGKLGLDLWTLFDNPSHQEIKGSYVPTRVTDDEGQLLDYYCVDIDLGKFKENTFIKEFDRLYSRLGFISSISPVCIKLLYGHDENRQRTGYLSPIEIENYTPNSYKYVSRYDSWIDDKSSINDWGNDVEMYIRFYFNSPDPVNIEVDEYLALNLDEILPSGHSLSNYLANIQVSLKSEILEILDILPWWSGEYEVGVSMPWGIARRMFMEYLQIEVGPGYLRLDPNYVRGIIFSDGTRYSVTYYEPESQEERIPDFNYDTHLLTVSTGSSLEIYYYIPDEGFDQPWDFSESDALLCNTSDLPYCRYGFNLKNSKISGDVVDIPRVTGEIILENCTNLTGSVLDLPQVRKYMNIKNCSSIVGRAENLWWMSEKPDLENSGVTGVYPY